VSKRSRFYPRPMVASGPVSAVGSGRWGAAHRDDPGGGSRRRVEWLWHAVPACPTISEVWLRLLESAGL